MVVLLHQITSEGCMAWEGGHSPPQQFFFARCWHRVKKSACGDWEYVFPQPRGTFLQRFSVPITGSTLLSLPTILAGM